MREPISIAPLRLPFLRHPRNGLSTENGALYLTEILELELLRNKRPNELAFLAATMKVEGPFRDRLAFRLHRNYEPDGFMVAREWDDIDLAVLDSRGTPLCLVELKAMYTFNALSSLSRFTSATSADEVKAQRLAAPITAVYSLLLVTHVEGDVPPHFVKPVKYSEPINRAIRKHGDSAAVLAKSTAAIDADLANAGRNVVARDEISGGSAFGLGVSVRYWLVRNDRPLAA